MMIMLFIALMSMFIYVNTLYYSMVLLIVVLILLYTLVSSLLMHTLTMIMLSIVYIGAMMILIGYICAICPNLILTPSYELVQFSIVSSISIWLLSPVELKVNPDQTFVPMVSYFYSYSGLVVFMALILMLFVTLLMVTSQYMTPKGPFRSVII